MNLMVCSADVLQHSVLVLGSNTVLAVLGPGLACSGLFL
jgi:hypothetical protein